MVTFLVTSRDLPKVTNWRLINQSFTSGFLASLPWLPFSEDRLVEIAPLCRSDALSRVQVLGCMKLQVFCGPLLCQGAQVARATAAIMRVHDSRAVKRAGVAGSRARARGRGRRPSAGAGPASPATRASVPSQVLSLRRTTVGRHPNDRAPRPGEGRREVPWSRGYDPQRPLLAKQAVRGSHRSSARLSDGLR